jgi:hypothetical protein
VLSLAPPPAASGSQRVVAPRVERVDASLRFDVRGGSATGSATVRFRGGAVAGRPALDLRQEVERVVLDGRRLSPGDFAHRDLGAGPRAAMRVLDVVVAADSPHVLEVEYVLGVPDAAGAVPIGWMGDGVRFDLWMSDLHPGRYLEMWVPAPLVHDRFALHLDITLEGTDRPHTVLANTAGVSASRGGLTWSLVYPAAFTALSPMLVMAPTDLVEVRRRAVSLPGRQRSLGLVTAKHADTDADLAGCESDVAGWLAHLFARYAPWAHGDTFTSVIWAPGRGMEYDGATTASVDALEHEVFHSWFGRGAKPARASDGWIDEAYTVWSTATGSRSGGRFDVTPLSLESDPVELYPPHPWSRHTPLESYTHGASLFAGLAHLMGGAGRLRSAMAEWYAANAGRLVTTEGLGAHLARASGLDIGPWWDRFVHGRG